MGLFTKSIQWNERNDKTLEPFIINDAGIIVNQWWHSDIDSGRNRNLIPDRWKWMIHRAEINFMKIHIEPLEITVNLKQWFRSLSRVIRYRLHSWLYSWTAMGLPAVSTIRNQWGENTWHFISMTSTSKKPIYPSSTRYTNRVRTARTPASTAAMSVAMRSPPTKITRSHPRTITSTPKNWGPSAGNWSSSLSKSKDAGILESCRQVDEPRRFLIGMSHKSMLWRFLLLGSNRRIFRFISSADSQFTILRRESSEGPFVNARLLVITKTKLDIQRFFLWDIFLWSLLFAHIPLYEICCVQIILCDKGGLLVPLATCGSRSQEQGEESQFWIEGHGTYLSG